MPAILSISDKPEEVSYQEQTNEPPGRSAAASETRDHHGIELLVQCVSVSMSLIWYTCRGGVANVA